MFSGGGTLNLQDLSIGQNTGGSNGFLFPSFGVYHGAGVCVGATTQVSIFGGLSFVGPASFGTGDSSFADIILGDFGGIRGEVLGGSPAGVIVADTYTSGATLSGTSIFTGQTFASLGLTPGTYTWTWGVDNPDSYTLNIGTNSTPVPGPLPIIGVAAAFNYSRKLKKRIRAAKFSVSSVVD